MNKVLENANTTPCELKGKKSIYIKKKLLKA